MNSNLTEVNNTTNSTTTVVDDIYDATVATEAYAEYLVHHWNTDSRIKLELAVQRWPALFSVLCSIYVIQDILRNRGGNNNNSDGTDRTVISISNRIVVALSVCDILYSFFLPFLGAWVAPAGIAYGAVGMMLLVRLPGSYKALDFMEAPTTMPVWQFATS